LGRCCRRAPPPPSAALPRAAAAGSLWRVVLLRWGRMPPAPAGVRRAGQQQRAAAGDGDAVQRCCRSVGVQTLLFTSYRPRTVQRCLRQ